MRPKMYIANMVQSCAPENVQHSQDDKFLNSEKIYSVSGIPTSQAESNMFMQNPREYLTEDKFAEVLKKLPPLGLKLDKAKFFMDSNQEKISHKQRGNLATQIGHSDLKSLPEKEARKASKIVTFLLKIGSWQRVSRNEEDVVAKCYFSKRRFVWEILENGLKKKIEIQWEYILSMRVVIIEYQPGILEVELNQQPMFFGETDPEPKKHSRWKHIADFTDGQATICSTFSNFLQVRSTNILRSFYDSSPGSCKCVKALFHAYKILIFIQISITWVRIYLLNALEMAQK
ncbi:hypothetical protein L484_000631 [Morus notabilis]|uniref:TRF2/HOY1 PH-like domain-containing protein n=1 Tax=Morus notabilis TaxID=981085 RepID=W9SE83_9ROSA|nr:hypothetical protein L484_000631 [Morus notabilis]